MNTLAEVRALKKRVAELEGQLAPTPASPATAGDRYGAAQKMAREATELPGSLERDVCGMVRINS